MVVNDYLGLVENAREDGMDVTFDCYTYPYSGTTITILLPDWSKDGGPEALMNNLKSSISRKKMCQEINHNAFKENWLTNFKNKHNKILEGLSVSEIALFKDKDPCETLFDLLIDDPNHPEFSIHTQSEMIKKLPLAHKLYMNTVAKVINPPPLLLVVTKSLLKKYEILESSLSATTELTCLVPVLYRRVPLLKLLIEGLILTTLALVKPDGNDLSR